MRYKIDGLINANEMASQAMQAKLALANKKQQEKMVMWQDMKSNEKRKGDMEEHRHLLEEKRL